jgi:hypothetical protein
VKKRNEKKNSNSIFHKYKDFLIAVTYFVKFLKLPTNQPTDRRHLVVMHPRVVHVLYIFILFLAPINHFDCVHICSDFRNAFFQMMMPRNRLQNHDSADNVGGGRGVKFTDDANHE